MHFFIPYGLLQALQPFRNNQVFSGCRTNAIITKSYNCWVYIDKQSETSFRFRFFKLILGSIAMMGKEENEKG